MQEKAEAKEGRQKHGVRCLPDARIWAYEPSLEGIVKDLGRDSSNKSLQQDWTRFLACM